jgi:hypothetical protein
MESNPRNARESLRDSLRQMNYWVNTIMKRVDVMLQAQGQEEIEKMKPSEREQAINRYLLLLIRLSQVRYALTKAHEEDGIREFDRLFNEAKIMPAQYEAFMEKFFLMEDESPTKATGPAGNQAGNNTAAKAEVDDQVPRYIFATHFPSQEEEAMEPIQRVPKDKLDYDEYEDVDAIDNDDLDDESEVTPPFKPYIDPFPHI